ncbi:Na(+)-translocating NADH-quinone reductase subunit A [uncultured Oceanicoccus sp.]|uniref:Na(+)-translocating NADH-quinone reductase subunit A n=1 Tax=uncultured Oceanicoccus sp. TaxID=1706381 RepID=UPI0030DC2716
MIKISRGLDLPISGVPVQAISEGAKTRSVALVGYDYIGMKPTMSVQVGDRVKTGQLLFTDKKTEGVKYTSPASGIVSAINRGDKRVFQSIVIDVEGDDFETFETGADIDSLDRQQVIDTLVNSGQWTALRTRPYSRVPAPDSAATAIFVTAIDTHPLAADPAVIIADQAAAFVDGLTVLTKLNKKVFVATAPGGNISTGSAKVETAEFAGPHPAGLVGTHMHYLNPVSANKVAWSIGYQDVIAIGKLFNEGKLSVERVVALAGPQVDQPQLVKTRLGTDLQELTAGKLKPENNRIISGSVLGGRTARGAVAYLGRYHQQVSVIKEGDEREFMGWLSPGASKHSNLGIYLSRFSKNKLMNFTTSTNGSERAMVPVGSFETIMPLDILPTQLLRSLIVGDTQMAQDLGCLELDEEDLALCTYVCSGKYEYGPILRDNLTRIEKEG